VDPLWIDVQRLRQWPNYCDTNHHGSCHGFTSDWKIFGPSPPSFLLIDVFQHCLAHASGSTRYLALSYVWGQQSSKSSNMLETTKENFSELTKPGALSSTTLSSQSLATVRDAISFTKAMGEQYLWVDRLCIIQDDDEHKAEQLRWMGSIYANSYFTIIAADSKDANYGLHGVGDTSLPRLYKQDILQFAPSCSMMPSPRNENQFNKQDWHKRGWTYQERALSNRRMVFFEGTVFWSVTSRSGESN
jgi:Heterokaryon incompatibility protein (HET)